MKTSKTLINYQKRNHVIGISPVLLHLLNAETIRINAWFYLVFFHDRQTPGIVTTNPHLKMINIDSNIFVFFKFKIMHSSCQCILGIGPGTYR